jgi:hypothetical protein
MLITFLDEYNPDQFEITGIGKGQDGFIRSKIYKNPKQIDKNGKITNGGKVNTALAIAHEMPPVQKIYYTSDNSAYLTVPFARILIKRKDA